MSTVVREFLAGGASILLLLGLQLATDFDLLPAMGLAAVVYVALRLLLPSAAPRVEEVEVAQGVTREDLGTTTQDLLATAEKFEHLAKGIRKAAIAEDLRAIGRIVRDLVKQFERDPQNLHLAEVFLSTHLPRAQAIVERYAWLARQRYLDEQARRELEASEETIALIEKAFEAQHGKLLAEDFREFHVDRRVFEELLHLDPSLRLGDSQPKTPDRERGVE